MDLFWNLIDSGQMLWIVSFALYASDCVRRISGSQGLIEMGFDHRWHFVFPAFPEQSASRRFGLMNVLSPHLPTLKVSWLLHSSAASDKKALRLALLRFRPLQIVSVVVPPTLFVFAPVVTHFRGIAYSLALVGPVVLISLVFAAAVLAALGRRLSISRKLIASFIFECAVCPGYLANVYRRAIIRFVALNLGACGRIAVPPAQAAQLDQMLAEMVASGEMSSDQANSVATQVGQPFERELS